MDPLINWIWIVGNVLNINFDGCYSSAIVLQLFKKKFLFCVIFAVDNIVGNVLNINLDGSYNSLAPSLSMGSFPVNVICFIKIEPSIVRFNCLPVSKVECLLQVPSLELVFSSKGSEAQGYLCENSPPMKLKGKELDLLCKKILFQSVYNSYDCLYSWFHRGCMTTAGEVYSSRANIHTFGFSRVSLLSWV